MKRKIIKIDEKLCNGCGACVPDCPEGAIQIVDGKARVISDSLCDGLGACIGRCPTGALTIEERDSEAYDERKVMENIISQGMDQVSGHLQHLADHKETEYLRTAREVLKEKGIEVPPVTEPMPRAHHHGGSCPGSRSYTFNQQEITQDVPAQSSALSHWPIQMHLISPQAPYFQGADLLVAADCTAFSFGAFHSDLLRGKKLIIACPKLDEGQEVYREKLISLINDARVNTITVVVMQVPCCSGLLRMIQAVVENSSRKVPVKNIVIGIQGEILREEWV